MYPESYYALIWSLADLAHTVLTKCVHPHGNIKSESFEVNLDFGLIEDIQEMRKVTENRSLMSGVRSASSNLLNIQQRYVHVYVMGFVHVLFHLCCACTCTCMYLHVHVLDIPKQLLHMEISTYTVPPTYM